MSKAVGYRGTRELLGRADGNGYSGWRGNFDDPHGQARVAVGNAPASKEPLMLIDKWLGQLWNLSVHYWGIASDAPTHFDRRHWMVFSVICVVVGCLCMRGFGSRKDY